MFICHKALREHLFRICCTGPRYVLPVPDMTRTYLCKIPEEHSQENSLQGFAGSATVRWMFLESASTHVDFLYSRLFSMSSVSGVWVPRYSD